MDRRIILDAINRYVNTIEYLGSISSEEYGLLMIISFLDDLVNNGMAVGLEHEDIAELNRLIQCLRESKHCVTRDLEYVDDLGFDNFHIDLDSIITNDAITISTGAGADMVSQARQTIKFTDFNMQYAFDPNDYIVGYDDETNIETRVNVGTVASIWS